MSFDVAKAKSRISSYTTSLNAKITGAEQLADQVLSPPILKSELVCDQMNKRLAEVQEAWDKLSSLLDQVIELSFTKTTLTTVVPSPRHQERNITSTTKQQNCVSTMNAVISLL